MNTILNKPRGFTLIEVLIALLVLSIGLLGVAALQMRGQQFNHAAAIRTHSTLLAYEIMDKMRLNQVCADDVFDDANDLLKPCLNAGGSGLHGYVVSLDPGAEDCEGVVCDRIKLRKYDLHQWYTRLANTLPEGMGTITWCTGTADAPCFGNNNSYAISISWADRDETSDDKTWTQYWVFRLF